MLTGGSQGDKGFAAFYNVNTPSTANCKLLTRMLIVALGRAGPTQNATGQRNSAAAAGREGHQAGPGRGQELEAALEASGSPYHGSLHLPGSSTHPTGPGQALPPGPTYIRTPEPL